MTRLQKQEQVERLFSGFRERLNRRRTGVKRVHEGGGRWVVPMVCPDCRRKPCDCDADYPGAA